MSEKNKKGKKDLTVSQVDRQNILNNPYALQEIEKATRITGIPFEEKTVVLKEQVSAFFEVTLRTIENYLGQHGQELAQNGYEILKGNRLRKLKLAISDLDVPETDFGNITKAPQLGVFDFRAFLNLAMLITESERARLKCIAKRLRSAAAAPWGILNWENWKACSNICRMTIIILLLKIS